MNERLYVNGTIYTMDEDRPWASALLTRDRRIQAVGDTSDVEPLAGPGVERTDLGGRFVMPGLHDAHLHLLFSGLKWLREGRLEQGAGPDRIVQDLEGCQCFGPIDESGHRWIVAGEYSSSAFPDGTARRDSLDAAFPDDPVFLFDYTIHHGLANSKAFELAGVQDDVPNPSGGKYMRDSVTGGLTGEMVEQARWKVMRAIPPHPDEVYREVLSWAVGVCHRFGITSVQEASASKRELEALKELETSGELALHVAAHLVWREEGFGMASLDELDELIEQREQYSSEHVDTSRIKVWLDGAPLPPHHTQADLTPDGAVDDTNILVPQEELTERLVAFDRQGLGVKIHCAGSGSTRLALDALDEVRRRNGDGSRHEIAHAGFIDTSDYARMRELDVVAEMSPALWHLPSSRPGTFNFATVLDEGILMTVGSDWIITPDPNLFPALQGMLQRGEQSVQLAEALRAMTLEGVRAVGRADDRGSLQVGKSADFIVLDRNLFDVPVEDIGATMVVRTVFEGETVFQQE